jgi:Flp pilus assembly pilin Flp
VLSRCQDKHFKTFDKSNWWTALWAKQSAVRPLLQYQGNWGREGMLELFRTIWADEQGQDIAEYAVMLAVILVLVIGTVRLIGTNSNTVFSQVASSIQ